MIQTVFLNPYFVSLFFLGINLLVYGYEYGNNSYHDYLLPYINKIIDPSLYPGDPYLNTLHAFPSPFIYAIGYLGKIFSLEGLHFTLYLIAKYLLFIAAFKLAEFLFKNKLTALLAVLLFALAPLVNVFGLLGEEAVMKFLLYQTTFSAPFFIFVIYLFLQKKYPASLLLLAALFLINALTSFHLLVILLFGSTVILKNSEGQNEKKPLIVAWLIFFALWIPYLFWSISKTAGLTSNPQFMLYLKNYYSGHYFPFSWDAAKYLKALCFIALFTVFFFHAPLDKNKKTVRAFAVGVFTLWLAAFIFSEVIPLRIPTILMPFRSDIFLIIFGLLYAADYIRKLIFSPKASHPIMALLLTLTLTDIQLLTPLVLAALSWLFLVFFANENKNINNVRFKKFISAFYLLSLVIVFCLCISWIIYSPLKIKSYVLILLTIGFLIASHTMPVLTLSSQNQNRYVAGIIIVCVLINCDLIAYRMKAGELSFVSPIRSDWRKTQLWARENTPADSFFVVPPYINGFRSFSKRAVFVEKIDAGAMHWYPGYELPWAQRLKELGYSEIPLLQYQTYNLHDPVTVKTRAIYAQNRAENFMALKKKYGINYVITENNHPLPFPLLYQNESFSLYSLPR